MPASDLHDPHDRDDTGALVATLYCPDCGHYSGGGLCRVCQREIDEGLPRSARPFVAIVCARGRGCQVVTTPSAQSVTTFERRSIAMPIPLPINSNALALATPHGRYERETLKPGTALDCGHETGAWGIAWRRRPATERGNQPLPPLVCNECLSAWAARFVGTEHGKLL